jgi:HSP20 family protein
MGAGEEGNRASLPAEENTMALTRWEPFEGLTPLRDVMNQLFEESFIRPMRFGVVGRVFPVDVYETDADYVVEALLPGVKPEDVKITALRDTITIHATMKPLRQPKEKTDKAGFYVRQERYEGEMSRTIELPTEIDAEKIIATYEHGMLTLHAPKVEAAKPKQITVQVKEPALAH